MLATLAVALLAQDLLAPTLHPDSVSPTDPSGFAAAADFNGDGRPDLLQITTPVVGSTEVTIQFGEPGGGFQPQGTLALPPGLIAGGVTEQTLYVRDFNNDGALDVLLQGSEGGPVRLLVLEGDGAGALALSTELLPPSTLLAATPLQFDGDPEPEIALVRFASTFMRMVEVFDLTSAGPVQVASLGPFFETFPFSFFAADVDSDGNEDLVYGTTGGPLVLRQVPGVGLVGPEASVGPTGLTGAGSETRYVALDIDGDGDPDPVQLAGNSLRVYRNDSGTLVGQAEFSFEVDGHPLVDPSGGNINLFPVDWDADGQQELVGKLRGIPTGGLLDASAFVRLEFGLDFTLQDVGWLPGASLEPAIGLGDLDLDGTVDLIAARSWIPAGAPFTSTEELNTQFTQLTDPLSPLDADGDGDLDLVARPPLASFAPPFGTASVNDASGHLRTESVLELPDGVGSPVSAAAGDLDQDGRAEVLVGLAGNSGPQAFPAEGWARFESTPGGLLEFAGFVTSAILPSSGRPGRVLDANGDGLPDLAAPSQGYFPGDGLGGLGSLVSTESGPILDAADVDGDGDFDLLALSPPASTPLLLLRSNGTGGYTSEDLGAIGATGSRFIDLDDDGFPEVVGGLQWIGNSSGTLAAPALLQAQPATTLLGTISQIERADADGDGTLDLYFRGEATLPFGPNGVTPRVWIARGVPGDPLAFEPARTYANWPDNQLGDADSDGDLDAFGVAPLLGARVQAPVAGSLLQYGDAFAGTDGLEPLLGAVGPLDSASTQAELRLLGGLGGTLAYLAVGTDPVDLDGIPLPGMTLSVDPLLKLIPIPLGGAGGAAGEGSWSFKFPSLAALAGIQRCYQAFVLDPGSPTLLSASNGLRVRYGQ